MNIKNDILYISGNKTREEVINESSELYNCNLCGKTFKDKKKYNDHLDRKNKGKKFYCKGMTENTEEEREALEEGVMILKNSKRIDKLITDIKGARTKESSNYGPEVLKVVARLEKVKEFAVAVEEAFSDAVKNKDIKRAKELKVAYNNYMKNYSSLKTLIDGRTTKRALSSLGVVLGASGLALAYSTLQKLGPQMQQYQTAIRNVSGDRAEVLKGVIEANKLLARSGFAAALTGSLTSITNGMKLIRGKSKTFGKAKKALDKDEIVYN